MSDEPDKPIDNLNFAKITAYLKDKQFNVKCTVCGEDQWTVQYMRKAQPGEIGALYGFASMSHPTAKTLASIHFGGLPLIPLMCNTCGHTIMFNYIFVANKVAESEAGGENQKGT
jgi:hypothetical protein